MNPYSNVESIQLNLTFTDFDERTEPSHKEMILHPKNMTILRLKCPFVSCVNGGFDITGQIEEAIRRKKNEIQLNDTCNGWQDNRRVNKNRCLCELSCKAEITYKSE